MGLPEEQTSDQYVALQCWAGSRDFPRSGAEIHRQAGIWREKNTNNYRQLESFMAGVCGSSEGSYLHVRP